MKLWIDEDLSPSLTSVGHAAGYEATCVRDRGRLSAKDHALAGVFFEEDWVFVTNNAADFLGLAQERGLHPGLIFVELGTAAEEAAWLANAVTHIEVRAPQLGQSPASFMTNRVVEVDAAGRAMDYEWPESEPG